MFYTNARACRSQHINKLLKKNCTVNSQALFQNTFWCFRVIFCGGGDHTFMLPAAEEHLVMSFAPELNFS